MNIVMLIVVFFLTCYLERVATLLVVLYFASVAKLVVVFFFFSTIANGSFVFVYYYK